MKKASIVTLGLLCGCANFDQAAFQQGLANAYAIQNQQFQNNLALNQQLAAQRQAMAAPAAPSLMVLSGNLQSQAVDGTLRYCRYSNGVVTTISSVALCPLNSQ